MQPHYVNLSYLQAVLVSNCMATLCRCDMAVAADVVQLASGTGGLPPLRNIVHAGERACALASTFELLLWFSAHQALH